MGVVWAAEDLTTHQRCALKFPASGRRAPFPVRPVHEVEARSSERRWLIDELFTSASVGLLGGPPKAFKTWVAAELALAVATGTKAFGRFAAPDPGPVLFFGAEDPPPDLREGKLPHVKIGRELAELEANIAAPPRSPPPRCSASPSSRGCRGPSGGRQVPSGSRLPPPRSSSSPPRRAGSRSVLAAGGGW